MYSHLSIKPTRSSWNAVANYPKISKWICRISLTFAFSPNWTQSASQLQLEHKTDRLNIFALVMIPHSAMFLLYVDVVQSFIKQGRQLLCECWSQNIWCTLSWQSCKYDSEASPTGELWDSDSKPISQNMFNWWLINK